MFFATTALALTVSPVRVELTGDPGQTVKGEIILLNEQKEAKTFYSSFENFEAKGETGTPNFVPGKDGLATWIQALNQVTLAAQEKKTIPFTVQIPKNADPGGYFAAIFWSTTPITAQGGQVAVGAKIGTLVLLKVSGYVKEGGGLLEFKTLNSQHFFSALPISFVWRFQNSGNDRINPGGSIEVRNIFGFVSKTLNANEGQGNVLPASIRRFTVPWTTNDIAGQAGSPGFFGMVVREWSNFAFGRYTANLHLQYGQDNKEVAASYSFFVIPWQLLSLLCLVLVVVLLVFSVGIKKYNRWIIAQASRK